MKFIALLYMFISLNSFALSERDIYEASNIEKDNDIVEYNSFSLGRETDLFSGLTISTIDQSFFIIQKSLKPEKNTFRRNVYTKEFPRLKMPEHYEAGGLVCSLDGNQGYGVIAQVKADDTKVILDAINAWLIDPNTLQFIEINPSRVSCENFNHSSHY